MSASPSSSAQAAREALAVRLAHLRQEAGLTGKELSARCGWHPAKTTRIQKGEVGLTGADIRAWCAACGADDQATDLIETARAVESMYMEWRRLHRNGMRRAQEEFSTLHERAAVCRVYASNAVPGFLQVPDYAEALMRSITRFQGTPDDVRDAVAARLVRSRFLYEGQHRFVILLEEWVLRTRIGDTGTMARQLRRLSDVLPLPSVSLGVIPFATPRTIWPLEAFYVFDDQHAVVETLTAEINIRQPREITDYLRAFRELGQMAVYGSHARRLIESAFDGLG